MNTFSGTSINKKENVFLKVFGLVACLLIFIGFVNIFQNQIKNFLRVASSPIEKYFWDAGNTSAVFFASFINAGNVAKENKNLKTENQSLLIRIAELQTQEKQNESQLAMAGQDPAQEFKYVMAGIIGLNSAEDIISINKGSANGISEGMPVISQEKVVFGKVLKVYKNFSEVMLISNKNNVLNVKIQNNDKAQADIKGITRGSGNLGIYLDLVLIDSNVNKGDVLVTSALEGTFPKDLLVGKVEEANKNDLKPFQTIKIEPFFNLNNVESLFVITDYKTP